MQAQFLRGEWGRWYFFVVQRTNLGISCLRYYVCHKMIAVKNGVYQVLGAKLKFGGGG